MLCVACDDKESFESIEKWKSELRAIAPGVPILLVQTRIDRAKNMDLVPVTTEDLEIKCEEEGLQGVLETSATEYARTSLAFFKAI